MGVLYFNHYFQIERWWRELHSRLEKYFKRKFQMLLEQGHYDPNDHTDR